jgi:hypothetical protein
MTINSRMWGVSWRRPDKAVVTRKRKGAEVTEEDWREKLLKTGLPSIPGRTARLKAIYLLQIAAEVEHALMVQYLYAAYSLDEAFNQADGSETTQIVDRWKRDFRLVAREEMAHFVTVQNLLMSLGSEVYVGRENNFSDHPDAYPFPVRFEKFGLNSLARYVATEAPAEEEIPDPKTRSQLESVLKQADENSKSKVNRVGVLYAALYWLFLESDDARGAWQMPQSVKACMQWSGLAGVHMKDSDFVSLEEYREFAANSDEWEVYEDSLHVDDTDPRSRALKAIHWIMLQGEGPSGSDCDLIHSHFCRFLRIYEDLKANPGLAGAARSVPLSPVVLDSHRTEPVDSEAEPITHPASKLWAKLFNVRYQMLLLDVLLALSTSRKRDPGLRRKLTTWAARYEMEFLKQIGQLLPNLPRHRHSTQLRSGAPFETVPFPADNTKRWDQQRVLIEGSLELVRKLKAKISPHDQRFSLLQAIESFDLGRKRPVADRATASGDYFWKEGNRRIQR